MTFHCLNEVGNLRQTRIREHAIISPLQPRGLTTWGKLSRTKQNHFTWSQAQQGLSISCGGRVGRIPSCRVHWGASHITEKKEPNVSCRKFPCMSLLVPLLLQRNLSFRLLPKYLFAQKSVCANKEFQRHFINGFKNVFKQRLDYLPAVYRPSPIKPQETSTSQQR